MADITFSESFMMLLKIMVDCVNAVLAPTDEQIQRILEMFLGELPEYMRKALTKSLTDA